MKKFNLRRPSASLLISCLALFIALGGAAYAGSQFPKNSVGTKQLKKNAVTSAKLKKKSVTTAKIKPGAVTGTSINEATLGTVPSATNATNATYATNVSSVLPFSVGANAESMVTLAKTANFELMGICDPAGTFDPPGVQFENTGTAVVIYNRSTAPAYADSEDDESDNLGLNEGIVFNYDDNGDGGEAMSTDGHFLAAPSWANEQADVEDIGSPKAGVNYPFPTTCHFAGAAIVG